MYNYLIKPFDALSRTSIKRTMPSNPKNYSIDEAQELVNSVSWYHSFEIIPGVVTPGSSYMEPKSALDSLYVPDNLESKKALDIGAWDGPLTFELERRGAKAYALDIQDPLSVGFDVARRIIGSNATHYQGSVYQLPYDQLSNLDLVIFRGVYYHLKHPILAFERIASALKMGGTVHFEGEGLLSYVEDLNGKQVSVNLDSMIESNAPFCLIYPNSYKNASNWFVPTPAALESCMIAAGFEVKEMEIFRDKNNNQVQRLYGYAVKVREDSELLEHPIY